MKKAAEKCRDTYGSQSQAEAAQGIRNTKTVISVLLDMVKQFDTAYTEAKKRGMCWILMIWSIWH